MRRFRRGVTIQGGLTLLFTAYAAFSVAHPTALALVAANVAGAFVATAYAVLAHRDWTRGVIASPNWKAVLSMLSSVALLGVGTALTLIYGRIDSILLVNLSGTVQAGYYGAAYRMLDQTALIPGALLVPISPLIVRELRAHGMVRIASDSALRRIEVAAGVGLTCITIGAAHWAVIGLLGSAYTASARLLVILCIASTWSVLSWVSTAKAIHSYRIRPFVAVTLGGVVINVTANLLVIPVWAANGAAVVTIVTELACVVGYTMVAAPTSTARHFRGLASMVVAGGIEYGLWTWCQTYGVTGNVCFSVVSLVVGSMLILRTFHFVRRDLQTPAT
jgi:O-antigen/teichoic acid export membrane protein